MRRRKPQIGLSKFLRCRVGRVPCKLSTRTKGLVAPDTAGERLVGGPAWGGGDALPALTPDPLRSLPPPPAPLPNWV